MLHNKTKCSLHLNPLVPHKTKERLKFQLYFTYALNQCALLN